MNSEIELIKSRLLLSEVIRKKVHLQNRGNLRYVGLCPFHKEKTPSFFVNDESAHYHCFGCGAHGDIFTFMMQYEGINYREALEQVANMAGIELTKQDKKAKAQIEKNKIFFQIYEKATEFYHRQLFSKLGKKALNYILSRGITRETIVQYKLGFSPKDSSQLIASLSENFSEADLLASGILQKKNDFIYDPFYNRLIFPIQDQFKKFIAFGARIIDQGQPKYLNSAENPIFKKSNHLYGYSIAKNHICKQKEVIIVEGYMDVIALANSGIYNVVAPLGTSMKLSQIEMLWNICPEPTICFDNDEAGYNASLRIAYESLKNIAHNKSIKFTKLAYGKDPDEVVQNKGVEFFEQLVKKSISLADYIFDNEVSKITLNTPEKKSLLLENILKTANEITNPKVRKNYIYYFKSRYYDLLRSLNFNKDKITSYNKKDRIINAQGLRQAMSVQSKDKENLAIVGILYCYPELLNDNKIIEEFVSINLPNFLDKIRGILLELVFCLDMQTNFFYNKIKSALKNNGDFTKTLKELESFRKYHSHEEAKINLLRAFDIKKIRCIKEELKEVKMQIATGTELIERIKYLKKCEDEIQNKLKKC